MGLKSHSHTVVILALAASSKLLKQEHRVLICTCCATHNTLQKRGACSAGDGQCLVPGTIHKDKTITWWCLVPGAGRIKLSLGSVWCQAPCIRIRLSLGGVWCQVQ